MSDEAGAAMNSAIWELRGAGFCSHPVRLHGALVDTGTGELTESTRARACKDRREAVCPACAAVYRADAYFLVAAGLAGGKGVPPEAATHPALFVTLIAPSFGAVHSRREDSDGAAPRPCRRKAGRCGHGNERSCPLHHDAEDELLGSPICAHCSNYVGAVLFNAHVSALWQRTTTLLVRGLGQELGYPEMAMRRLARFSYVKVAEFQRRGSVHLHVAIRCDGAGGPADPPPDGVDAAVLARVLRRAVTTARVPVPGFGKAAPSEVRWGRQLDLQDLRVVGDDGPVAHRRVAGYLAKYACKSVDDAGALARPIHSIVDIETLRVSEHLRTMAVTAWRLGLRRELAHLRLRAHAHTLGYGGHATTKSRLYSTTFGALREARAAFLVEQAGTVTRPEGSWHFAGRGYDEPSAELLADYLATVMRDAKRAGGERRERSPGR